MELMELNPLTLRSRYVLTHFDFFLIRDRVENDMRNYLTARPIWGETFSFFFCVLLSRAKEERYEVSVFLIFLRLYQDHLIL